MLNDHLFVFSIDFVDTFLRLAEVGATISGRATQKSIPMLHAVTLIRSGIGRPHWQKKTLEILKLTKMHKTVIHKNTPSVNGMLASIKELIKVQPVVFRTDVENSPNGGQFLTDSAEFFIEEKELADLTENVDRQDSISKS